MIRSHFCERNAVSMCLLTNDVLHFVNNNTQRECKEDKRDTLNQLID